MKFYKFIKLKGKEGSNTGYFVPNMYQLVCSFIALKNIAFSYIKERLLGWTIWWVNNEDDYIRAIKTLDELKKTRIFDYEICETI